VLLWRKQRRRRAGVASKLSPSTDSSVTASGLSNGVKPHPSAEAAVGSSRGEPLRDVYGGAAAGRDGLSDDESGEALRRSVLDTQCTLPACMLWQAVAVTGAHWPPRQIVPTQLMRATQVRRASKLSAYSTAHGRHSIRPFSATSRRNLDGLFNPPTQSRCRGWCNPRLMPLCCLVAQGNSATCSRRSSWPTLPEWMTARRGSSGCALLQGGQGRARWC
jgi:hypothetical protein